MRSNLITAVLSSAILVSAIAIATAAHGQDRQPRYFTLYNGDRASAPNAAVVMKPRVGFGPFRSPAYCYAIGAMQLEYIEDREPGKIFMGRCDDGALLTLSEIAYRALALLPDQPKN